MIIIIIVLLLKFIRIGNECKKQEAVRVSSAAKHGSNSFSEKTSVFISTLYRRI